MKKLAIAAAALALLGFAPAANAQLDISFDPLGGDPSILTGTITNNSGTSYDSILYSVDWAPASVDLPDLTDLDMLSLDGLADGASSPFTLDFTGAPSIVSINLSVDNWDTIAGTGTFVVPEPGSVAMLLGMGVTGGMFLARRRRK